MKRLSASPKERIAMSNSTNTERKTFIAIPLSAFANGPCYDELFDAVAESMFGCEKNHYVEYNLVTIIECDGGPWGTMISDEKREKREKLFSVQLRELFPDIDFDKDADRILIQYD